MFIKFTYIYVLFVNGKLNYTAKVVTLPLHIRASDKYNRFKYIKHKICFPNIYCIMV